MQLRSLDGGPGDGRDPRRPRGCEPFRLHRPRRSPDRMLASTRLCHERGSETPGLPFRGGPHGRLRTPPVPPGASVPSDESAASVEPETGVLAFYRTLVVEVTRRVSRQGLIELGLLLSYLALRSFDAARTALIGWTAAL